MVIMDYVKSLNARRNTIRFAGFGGGWRRVMRVVVQRRMYLRVVIILRGVITLISTIGMNS